MYKKLLFISLGLFILTGCKSEPKAKKKTELEIRLDSIDLAKQKMVLESGDKVTKAYVDPETNKIDLWADIKLDHRFYGFEKADVSSKRLILFSIFTDDVENNPFSLPLGSFYSTANVEGGVFKFISEEGNFVKAEHTDKDNNTTTVYFERKWIVLDGDETYDEDNDDSDLADDAIPGFGIIDKYEDGVYPMFVVTIHFVEKNYKIDFDLNIESVSINSEELNDLVGKYVSFNYTSDWVETVNDIYFDGKSLSGKYAPELDKEWSVITGTLGGAESLSGDLPSFISITDADGEEMNFEWYVDDEVMKINKKEVTAYYSGRAINTIIDIKPSENN